MRRVKGFTLVELLVVIGIIALLIGILMPMLSKARKSAQGAACLSNLRQIGIGANIYASRWKGWCVPVYQVHLANLTDASGLQDYWDNNPDFRSLVSQTPPTPTVAPTYPLAFICPSAKRGLLQNAPDQLRLCYGINSTSVPYRIPRSATVTVQTAGQAQMVKLNKIRRSSEVVQFIDSVWVLAQPYVRTPVGGYNSSGANNATLTPGGEEPTSGRGVAYRHGGKGNYGANVAFYDGHAEFVPRGKLACVSETDPNVRAWDGTMP